MRKMWVTRIKLANEDVGLPGCGLRCGLPMRGLPDEEGHVGYQDGMRLTASVG